MKQFNIFMQFNTTDSLNFNLLASFLWIVLLLLKIFRGSELCCVRLVHIIKRCHVFCPLKHSGRLLTATLSSERVFMIRCVWLVMHC